MPWLKDLRSALGQYVQKVLQPAKPPLTPHGLPVPPFPPQPPGTLADVRARIQWAGRNRRLLVMGYRDMDGNQHAHRDVEPYSYRYRAKKDRHIPLFYAYCRLHNEIHCFKLQGITDCQIKDELFTPRQGWVVEF